MFAYEFSCRQLRRITTYIGIPHEIEARAGASEQCRFPTVRRLAACKSPTQTRCVIRHAVLVVAQAEIQGKVSRYFPIVFEVKSPIIFVKVPLEQNGRAIVGPVPRRWRVDEVLFLDAVDRSGEKSPDRWEWQKRLVELSRSVRQIVGTTFGPECHLRSIRAERPRCWIKNASRT